MRIWVIRNAVALLIAICIVGGYLTWWKVSQGVIESTTNTVRDGLYVGLRYINLEGKRVYQPQGRYYYPDIYDASNLTKIEGVLSNYVKSHDPTPVEIKYVSLRITSPESMVGFATVMVKMFPGITKTIVVNDGVPLLHYKRATGPS
jgi:hypothetical protein